MKSITRARHVQAKLVGGTGMSSVQFYRHWQCRSHVCPLEDDSRIWVLQQQMTGRQSVWQLGWRHYNYVTRHHTRQAILASLYLQIKLRSFPPVPRYRPIYSDNGATERVGHQGNDAWWQEVIMTSVGRWSADVMDWRHHVHNVTTAVCPVADKTVIAVSLMHRQRSAPSLLHRLPKSSEIRQLLSSRASPQILYKC